MSHLKSHTLPIIGPSHRLQIKLPQINTPPTHTHTELGLMENFNIVETSLYSLYTRRVLSPLMYMSLAFVIKKCYSYLVNTITEQLKDDVVMFDIHIQACDIISLINKSAD